MFDNGKQKIQLKELKLNMMNNNSFNIFNQIIVYVFSADIMCLQFQ